MKNPMVYYALIGIGIVGLALGIYFEVTATAAAPIISQARRRLFLALFW